MNIIKISEDIFNNILNEDIKHLDAEHLPYNTICIAFPYYFLRSSDDMIEDSLKEFKKEVNKLGLSYKKSLEDNIQFIEESKKRIIKYCNSNLNVIFNSEKYEITVKHSKPSIIGYTDPILFNAYTYIMPIFNHNKIPIVNHNEMSDNGIWLYKTLLKLISGVVYILNNPNTEVIEEKVYVGNSKSKRRRSSSRIRYVKNIRYMKNDNPSEIRPYTHNMEAWEVRGHWRTLKNGNKVWVSSYIKGDKEKLLGDNIYKINKK